MTSACLTLWPGALTVRARVLQDATGDGHPDGDEDQATDQFAALSGLVAETVPQLQPDQGQGDADDADEDCGGGEVDVIGA